MGRNNLRDGRIKNWFYLENDLLEREDLNIYEKMIYIVIARYVDKEDKAFPSVPTIAKKGSMSERQVQLIINSLVKKGLIKKESRINKYNKSKTSNLYTLLSVENKQYDKTSKKEVVNDMHHPNNTNLKNTNLNNVNKAGGEGIVDNSRDEIREKKTKDKKDINEIREKIRELLNGNDRKFLPGIKDNAKGKELPEKGNDPGESYTRDNKNFSYSEFNRRSEEKELLANEIANTLEDDHSLGAFQSIVDKIPEQQIRIFLSIIKDTYLIGKIKNNRGAMFVSLARAFAGKNNISLNFK